MCVREQRASGSKSAGLPELIVVSSSSDDDYSDEDYAPSVQRGDVKQEHKPLARRGVKQEHRPLARNCNVRI